MGKRYVIVIFFVPTVTIVLFVPVSMLFWDNASPAMANHAASRLLLHSYPFLFLLTTQIILLNCPVEIFQNIGKSICKFKN